MTNATDQEESRKHR